MTSTPETLNHLLELKILEVSLLLQNHVTQTHVRSGITISATTITENVVGYSCMKYAHTTNFEYHSLCSKINTSADSADFFQYYL